MYRIKILLLLVIFSCINSSIKANVTYDDKAFIINGKRRILMSGSIHYPRSTPEMWPDLIKKAKDGGLDVIATYVFWNGHEPSQGKFNFVGRYDLVKFIKLIQKAGLYVNLRIGPYICAEWNLGGFPVWLKFVPGISFRTDNGPFKIAMQRYTEKIVNMMKSEKLFEPQGGPIIMCQIENEYGPVEWYLNASGKAYSKWAAQMADGLKTGVPWYMSRQETAPDPLIDTCNGFYCEEYIPNKPNKPKMFTELWTGWFIELGGPIPIRPVEDIAYAVARFVQNNGSYVNYYMYHGGTNFGRTSGLFIATSYDYDAPIDEFGLTNEPKYSHLRNLHTAIKLVEPVLISAYPTVTRLGKTQEIHVFQPKSGGCAAFLSNYDQQYSTKMTFRNTKYDLPPWSITILKNCKDEIYNTAKVKAPTIKRKMTPGGKFTWQSYHENAPLYNSSDTHANVMAALYDQVNVTRDTSDYLWYLSEITISSNEKFLQTKQLPVLTVMSAGHGLHVFINNQLAGTVFGSLLSPKLTFSKNVTLIAGINKISMLSVSVGLANVGVRNVGAHFEFFKVGVLGPITLKGLNQGIRDLTKQRWSNKVGLKGEALSLHTLSGSSSVQWLNGSSVAQKQPLTWYKTTFNAPSGSEPLALDMESMGKGQKWLNGESLGRHWPGNKARGKCEQCVYNGTYNEFKCKSSCGASSQRWSHVPRAWLKPTGNLLVIFEEWGGNPELITLAKRT